MDHQIYSVIFTHTNDGRSSTKYYRYFEDLLVLIRSDADIDRRYCITINSLQATHSYKLEVVRPYQQFTSPTIMPPVNKSIIQPQDTTARLIKIISVTMKGRKPKYYNNMEDVGLAFRKDPEINTQSSSVTSAIDAIEINGATYVNMEKCTIENPRLLFKNYPFD